jgi:hypothetical protein
MYKLEGKEAYFLVDGYWVHEALIDFILGMKEEHKYGY